jgi:hypothetical protein
MNLFRSARWLMLGLLLAVIPVSQARAGVFISVGVAPPILPVYVQPPCPEPGLMWTPGYWAYDYDNGGYYWVPGAWVPAPYEGALWTPPFWGWESGVYMFHPGYWGMHVGYYGGVNYGFGYMGVGFVGGEWHGRDFAYNTAVVNVNRTVIHNTYINTTVVHETTIVNNNHIAYSGGPNGIHHDPGPEERVAMHEQHLAPTQYQQQHIQQARTERSNFFNANHGHPQQLALARPLPAAHYNPPAAGANMRGNAGGRPADVNGNAGANARPGGFNGNANGGVNARPGNVNGGNAGARGEYRPAAPANQPSARPAPESRPAPQQQYRPEPQQQQRPEARPAPESRPAPQQQYRPEPQQQYRPAPQPRPESRPAPQQQPRQEYRPAPQPRPESRPAPQQSRPEPRPESHPKEPRR